MKVRGFEFPEGLLYLVEQDTWVRRDADGLATMGITALGAHISGEFIDFIAKPIGTEVERDRSIGALEMSKVIRSARAPVAGTIVEVNAKVRGNPALINSDPYGEGWLARMRPASWDDDVKQLVAGDALVPAVEAYMSTLVEAFGMEKPPS